MPNRRIPVLVLAAALLHLNIVRADAACARHEYSAKPVPAQQSGHANHETHGSPAPASEHHGYDSDCDTPGQPECCQALASCSLAFSDNERTSVADAERHLIVAAGRADAPLSRVTTPDPPPPKA